MVVQAAFSANSSVALRLTREEEELDHLTSDLSALLRQVDMIHSVKGSFFNVTNVLGHFKKFQLLTCQKSSVLIDLMLAYTYKTYV